MSKLLRTMLYVPGNNPSMIIDAALYKSDALMFDLEDAISVNEKDAARNLVFHGLTHLEFAPETTVVRINGLDTPYGEADIQRMVEAGVWAIRLPKTESAQDVIDVEARIAHWEARCGRTVGITRMMAAIESPRGIMNAVEIACASQRLIGIAIGAEDYVTNLRTERTPGGTELLFARCQLLNAARTAGIAALDTVYSDVNNEEGFRAEVAHIKSLGFDGKSVINPKQIPIVHEMYAPTAQEIEKAKKVIRGIREAEAAGSGVIAVDGKMVDKPIVERAQRVLVLAGVQEVQ